MSLLFESIFDISAKWRFVLFDGSPEPCFINMVRQTLINRSMLIVPPGQLLLSRIVKGHACLEIADSDFSEFDRFFVRKFLYQNQKHFHTTKLSNLDFEQWECTLNSELPLQTKMSFIRSQFETQYQGQFGNSYITNSSYTGLANAFEGALKEIHSFSLDDAIISRYSEKLNCSEKTLRRACKNVFGASPIEIIRHFIMSRIITLLISRKYTLDRICQTLGYSSMNAFARFVKLQTGMTPAIIRQFLSSFSQEHLNNNS